MLQKSGRLVLWEAMFILELHSAETQEFCLITAHYSSSFSPSIKTEYAGSVTAVPSRSAISSPV